MGRKVTVKSSGHKKMHYTLVLSCLADGLKLPPLHILKRETMPMGNIPPGVFVHVHPKGWMDKK